jgi:hypothetical protein
MDLAEFEDLLDRQGDDFSCWSSEQQRAALVLLADSNEAKALLQEAQAMRLLLSGAPIHAPKGFADRVVTQALQQSPPNANAKKQQDFGQFWPVIPQYVPLPHIAFLLVCLFSGIIGGVLHSSPRDGSRMFDVHDFLAYVINIDMSRTAD